MTLIYAAMTLALAATATGSRRFAAAALLACLALSAGLFLFEIHSSQDGFAVPWLSTEGDGTPGPARETAA